MSATSWLSCSGVAAAWQTRARASSDTATLMAGLTALCAPPRPPRPPYIADTQLHSCSMITGAGEGRGDLTRMQ